MQDADAQDGTQNILVRIARAIGHYESQTGIRFRHWLSRVARSVPGSRAAARRDSTAGHWLELSGLEEISQEVAQELGHSQRALNLPSPSTDRCVSTQIDAVSLLGYFPQALLFAKSLQKDLLDMQMMRIRLIAS